MALTMVLGTLPLTPARALAAGQHAPIQRDVPIASNGRQEVVSLRTATSRTYQQAGQSVADIYPSAVNYQDTQGAWQPIDNILVASSVSGYAYQNAANRYSVLFPQSLGISPIKVQLGSSWVSFSLMGATASGTVSGNSIAYALPGATLTFTALGDELKESLSLAGPTSPSTYSFAVQFSPDLIAGSNAQGGIDFQGNGGRPVFSFAPPFMQDSAALPVFSRAVSLGLAKTGDGITVTLAADPSWLADPARVYPVTVDPTVDLNPSPDCFIEGNAGRDSNYCGNTELYAGLGTGSTPNRSLLKFCVQGCLPAGVSLQSASLVMDLVSESTTTPLALSFEALTRSWTSSLTWDKYDGTNPWTTPGGDYTTTDAGSNTLGGGLGITTTDLTSLVRDWLSGTLANDGLIVKEPTETVNILLGFDATGTSSNPYLEVTYVRAGGGVLPWYTSVSSKLSDHLGLSVNVANGDLVVQQSDVTMPGVGLPLQIDQTNNRGGLGGGELGAGWTIDPLDEFLAVHQGGAVDFFGPSSYDVSFTPAGSGYTSPPGLDATLVHHGDGTYTITFDATGLVDDFNANGSLTKEVDRSGNAISVNRDSKNVATSITDTQGHTTTIAYSPSNPGDIATITDPAGRTYQYGYNPSGYLSTYTDPDQKTTTYSYSTSGVLQQITDPLGNETTVSYNGSGSVAGVTRVTNISAAPAPPPTLPTTPVRPSSPIPTAIRPRTPTTTRDG